MNRLQKSFAYAAILAAPVSIARADDVELMMQEKTLYMSTTIQTSRGYAKKAADDVVYLAWLLTARELCSPEIFTEQMIVSYADVASKNYNIESKQFGTDAITASLLLEDQLTSERSSMIPPFCRLMWGVRRSLDSASDQGD